MNIPAVTAGAMIGLGLVIVGSELSPGPPRLNDALARLDGARRPGPRGRLTVRLSRLPVPREDLALLGISDERFTLQRVTSLLFGLVLPLPLTMLCAVAGVSLPWAVPTGAGVLCGALFALVPDYAVRSQARERRQEFRTALATYLDMVALERSAGAGPPQALQAPAEVCTGWVFRRIAQVLEHAKRAGEQPWRGLAQLGEEIRIAELTELADIAEDAGSEGAQVLSTLLAKAQSMRTTALTEARARANSRTSEMPIAIGISVFGFLALVCFPAVYRIMS
ncbi:type II secretion system F family protein [Microbispora sp. H10885]|uniref:type II secretion system F family protein n=1 Tax=Microbispora sp. H10885 TaxID=2729110 RepID=UPI001603FF04|nr:type II secretion system F family protein [Microbispora sp. H10885]